MRLIDANEIRIKPEYMYDICGSVMIRVEDVARIINEMPTIEPEQHWTPCSERPPEEDDVEVLCTVKQQNKTNRSETIIVEQGCYFYGTWLLSYDNQRVNCSREVLAWQPLPSPYRGEGEQNEINRC